MPDMRTSSYAGSLSELIHVETISVSGVHDAGKFRAFHKILFAKFPKLFETAETEDFNGSLLIRWRGRDESLEPILLMSHHDVVEAPGTWQHEPFSGEIADGKLWGRGTLDTKGSLWAMLQAAEELAEAGFVPSRDIYFESACDEETDGLGADAISKALSERGVSFFMTLDEGGMIMYDPIGGADAIFAMVGVGEKGCADLKFTARSGGGHASTPGKNTPLVRLGKFMAAVERASIFKVELSDVVREMFMRMSPTMKMPLKYIFSKPNTFAPLIKKVMPLVSDTAGAMLKTTVAFTMARGSDGTNVLPQEAYVIGNMRFSHHQGGSDSIAAIKRLAARFDIETEILDPGFESPLTDYRGDAFKLIEKAVAQVFPDCRTAPYVMTGASDSRFFGRVSKSCLRFAPFVIDDGQLESIHGINENIDLSALAPAVDFYKYIIQEV